MANEMGYRETMFVTRPQRDPQFHKEALEVLKDVTENFTLKWDRPLQKEYERALGKAGLKGPGVSADGSGGRTWAAMLRTYDYLYIDQDGFFRLNRVGEKIVAGVKVRENISKQLLNLQIPNAYFLSKRFKPKFHPDFAIQPIRFLIKVTNQKMLNYYVTKEEIVYFVLTAKKNSDLEKTVLNIAEYRRMDKEEQAEVRADIVSAMDSRRRIDAPARDFFENNADIAHTLMLQAEYTDFVEYIRRNSIRIPAERSADIEEKINKFDLRYPFNKRYKISLEAYSRNNGLDIDSYKASYGNKVASPEGKISLKIKKALSKVATTENMSEYDIKQLLINEGIKENDAEKYVDKIMQKPYEKLDDNFVISYLNQENNLEFEKQTENVLNMIGFKSEYHPKPVSDLNAGQEDMDVMLFYEESLVLIDAKNYGDQFSLTANLRSHMATSYIPGYDGYDGKRVKYFGYVAASEKIGGKVNLEKVQQIVKSQQGYDVHGMIITASTLLDYLDYCITEDIPIRKRVNDFMKIFDNELYDSFSKIRRKINDE